MLFRSQSMWTQAIAAGPTGQPILDGLAFEFNTQTPGVLDWIVKEELSLLPDAQKSRRTQ